LRLTKEKAEVITEKVSIEERMRQAVEVERKATNEALELREMIRQFNTQQSEQEKGRISLLDSYNRQIEQMRSVIDQLSQDQLASNKQLSEQQMKHVLELQALHEEYKRRAMRSRVQQTSQQETFKTHSTIVTEEIQTHPSVEHNTLQTEKSKSVQKSSRNDVILIEGDS